MKNAVKPNTAKPETPSPITVPPPKEILNALGKLVLAACVVLKKILKVYSEKFLCESIKTGSYIPLLLEILNTSKIKAATQKEIYQMLGILIKINKNDVKIYHNEIMDMFLLELKNQVFKEKKPEISQLIGALKGIYHSLEEVEISPEKSNIIHH